MSLPISARKNINSISYVEGMQNRAFQGGILVDVDREKGLLHLAQVRNANHRLPVEFDPIKTPLPKAAKEGDFIMATCHVFGRRVKGDTDQDERHVYMRAISFDEPNVMHFTPEQSERVKESWKKTPHPNAKDLGIPKAIQDLGQTTSKEVQIQTQLDDIDWRGLATNTNATNNVVVSGFVHVKSYETKRTGPEGQPLNDRLIVLLRQHGDPDKCITIRWYLRNLKPLADRIMRGLPISVVGQFKIDAKAIGAPDPEKGGEQKIHRIPYIQATDFPVLVLPDDPRIQQIPDWAHDLLDQDALEKARNRIAKDAPEGDAESVDRAAAFAKATAS